MVLRPSGFINPPVMSISIFRCGHNFRDVNIPILKKIYPVGYKKLFGKATKEKRRDKEFSIIPYHSASPCEYPCGATFAPKKTVGLWTTLLC